MSENWRLSEDRIAPEEFYEDVWSMARKKNLPACEVCGLPVQIRFDGERGSDFLCPAHIMLTATVQFLKGTGLSEEDAVEYTGKCIGFIEDIIRSKIEHDWEPPETPILSPLRWG